MLYVYFRKNALRSKPRSHKNRIKGKFWIIMLNLPEQWLNWSISGSILTAHLCHVTLWLDMKSIDSFLALVGHIRYYLSCAPADPIEVHHKVSSATNQLTAQSEKESVLLTFFCQDTGHQAADPFKFRPWKVLWGIW